jgi:hypothetical protein
MESGAACGRTSAPPEPAVLAGRESPRGADPGQGAFLTWVVSGSARPGPSWVHEGCISALASQCAALWLWRLHLVPPGRLRLAPPEESVGASNWTHLAFLAAQLWPTLPAGQGRSSSIRCGRSTLTCGSSPAIGQQSRKAEFKSASSHLVGAGAISSPHRTCLIRGGATRGRRGGSTATRHNQPCQGPVGHGTVRPGRPQEPRAHRTAANRVARRRRPRPEPPCTGLGWFPRRG